MASIRFRLRPLLVIACMLLPCLLAGAKPATIRWKAVRNAAAYRVEVKNESGRTIQVRETRQTSLKLQLSTGSYRIRISTLDAFKKIATRSRWFNVRVVKAQHGQIDRISPSVAYTYMKNNTITVHGKKFKKATRVQLIKGGRRYTARLTGSSSGSISFVVDGTRLSKGNYDLVISLAGGGRLQRDDAINVNDSRRRFEPLTGVYLGSGVQFQALLPNWNLILRDGMAQGDLNLAFYLGNNFGLETQFNWISIYNDRYNNSSIYDLDRMLLGMGIYVAVDVGVELIARLGAGGVYTWMHSEVDNQEKELHSTDFYGRVGVATRLNFLDFMFLEAGCDFYTVFYLQQPMAYFAPYARLGVRLFPQHARLPNSPVIKSVSPSRILWDRSVTVTVSGSKFDKKGLVELRSGGNRFLPQVVSRSATSITLRIKAKSLPRGLYTLRVTNPGTAVGEKGAALFVTDPQGMKQGPYRWYLALGMAPRLIGGEWGTYIDSGGYLSLYSAFDLLTWLGLEAELGLGGSTSTQSKRSLDQFSFGLGAYGKIHWGGDFLFRVNMGWVYSVLNTEFGERDSGDPFLKLGLGARFAVQQFFVELGYEYMMVFYIGNTLGASQPYFRIGLRF